MFFTVIRCNFVEVIRIVNSKPVFFLSKSQHFILLFHCQVHYTDNGVRVIDLKIQLFIYLSQVIVPVDGSIDNLQLRCRNHYESVPIRGNKFGRIGSLTDT